MSDLSAFGYDLDRAFDEDYINSKEATELAFVDEDNDPLADIGFGREYISFNGQTGMYSYGDEELGREVVCYLLEFTKCRDLWPPKNQGDEPVELLGFPNDRPLCSNGDADRSAPRLNGNLTADQQDVLRNLGAGFDCSNCQVKGCRKGRRLLVFAPKVCATPAVLQIAGTSIGPFTEAMRKHFKERDEAGRPRSLPTCSRPLKLGTKLIADEKDKSKRYYRMEIVAGARMPQDFVDQMTGLAEAFSIRAQQSQALPEHQDSGAPRPQLVSATTTSSADVLTDADDFV